MDDLTFLLGRLKVFAYLYLKPSLSQVPAAINASHPGSHVRNPGLRPISSTSSSSPSHFNVVHYLSLFFCCSDPPVSLALTAFLPNVSPFQLHSAARMISFQTANPFIYLLFKPFNSLLPPSEEKVKCTNWPTRSSFSLSWPGSLLLDCCLVDHLSPTLLDPNLLFTQTPVWAMPALMSLFF